MKVATENVSATAADAQSVARAGSIGVVARAEQGPRPS